MNHAQIAQICQAYSNGGGDEGDIEALARLTQVPVDTIRAILQDTSPIAKPKDKVTQGRDNAGKWG